MATNRTNSSMMKAVIFMVTVCLFAASMLRAHHHDCSGALCLSLSETSHTHAHHSHGCDDSACPLQLSAAVNFADDDQHAIHSQQDLSDFQAILPPELHSELTISTTEIYHHYVDHLCRWLPEHSVSRGPPMA